MPKYFTPQPNISEQPISLPISPLSYLIPSFRAHRWAGGRNCVRLLAESRSGARAQAGRRPTPAPASGTRLGEILLMIDTVWWWVQRMGGGVGKWGLYI